MDKYIQNYKEKVLILIINNMNRKSKNLKF